MNMSRLLIDSWSRNTLANLSLESPDFIWFETCLISVVVNITICYCPRYYWRGSTEMCDWSV